MGTGKMSMKQQSDQEVKKKKKKQRKTQGNQWLLNVARQSHTWRRGPKILKTSSAKLTQH